LIDSLTKVAKGRIGETLVMLELEYRGWMVFRPDFEEKIDMVAAWQERADAFGAKERDLKIAV
jgi:ribosomal protein L30/L7E